MARFKQVGHFDHPGTPMQVIGGVVLQSAWIANPYGGDTLTEAVLKEPEHYLGILNRSVAVLGALAVFIAGIITRRFTRNAFFGLVVQAAPFISGIVLYSSFVRISQESVLMMASMAMTVYILYWYFTGNSRSLQSESQNELQSQLPVDPPKGIYRFLKSNDNIVTGFSIISAFGLASKIIFLPLMLLPWILLEKRKPRLEYLKLTAVYFVLFTLPIVLLYPRMGWWFIRLFIYSGTYGSGRMNIVDTAGFTENLLNLLTGQPAYLALYLAAVATFILLALIRLIKKVCYDKRATMLLAVIILVQTLGFVITAKHPKLAYLLPYEIIASALLVVIIHLIASARFVRYVLSAAAAVLLVMNGLREKEPLQAGAYKEQFEVAWQTALSAAEGGAVIGINPGPSPIAAMFFGNVYTRDRYNNELHQLYPDFYIFDLYGNRLINWNYDTLSLQTLSQKYTRLSVIGSDVQTALKLMQPGDDMIVKPVVTGVSEVYLVKDPEK